MSEIRLKLKEFLDEKNISRYQLAQGTDICYESINNYYKNRVVRYDSDVIRRICDYLDCGLLDIIEYKKG